ncbi:rhomboid family intramembrane serine protease [Microbulbifer sp. SAOS-129_SWC]|uniref:rhomboid family intramembrane serine protease n=1 Tax=Microbulbifer sp. SAOS-129_SWC TaxID=3145235 RepID=UPI003216D961
MSHWTTLREFPLDQDLTELARFIQRCHLPLRISEEGNRQRLSTPDPRLGDLLLPLLDRWSAGELDLDQVRVEPVPAEPPEAGPAPDNAATDAADTSADNTSADNPGTEPPPAAPAQAVSTLPSWPWHRTPLSLVLIALCFIGWLVVRENLEQLLAIYPQPSGGFSPGNSSLAWHLRNGEYWRLWTPAILHFSLPHALFNAMGIWILGRPLEARAGKLAFAALVLIAAPVSNLAQYYWSPQILFGGMSGVVYALGGSVFVLQRWQPQWSDVPAGIVALMVGWLLICATGLFTFIFGVGIANAAHLGGFVSGLLLTALYCLAGGAKNFAASGVRENDTTA